MTERVASQAGTREPQWERQRALRGIGSFFFDVCPHLLNLTLSLNIANFSSNVPCCCAEGGEGARGKRALGAGTRKPNIFLASAVWSGPGHEGEEEEKGKEGGFRVGRAAEARLHLHDS